jgi:hypothetical protein
MTAPTLLPALNRAVARARSLAGNHSDRLDGGREVPALADAERRPGHDEPGDAAHGGVGQRRQAPREERHPVPDLRPEAVDEDPEQEETHGVGGLERGVDLAELLVRPPELGVQDRLEQGEDLTIHVVDRRRQEQQGADDPAVPADASRSPVRRHLLT